MCDLLFIFKSLLQQQWIEYKNRPRPKTPQKVSIKKLPGKKIPRKETKNKERFNRLSLKQPEKAKLVKKPGLTIRERRRLEQLEKGIDEEEIVSPRANSRRDSVNSRAYTNNVVKYSVPRKSSQRPQSELLTHQYNHTVSDSELTDREFPERGVRRRQVERVHGVSSSTGNYQVPRRHSDTRAVREPRDGQNRGQGSIGIESGWFDEDSGEENMTDIYDGQEEYNGGGNSYNGYDNFGQQVGHQILHTVSYLTYTIDR